MPTRDTRQNRLIIRPQLTVPGQALNRQNRRFCHGTNKKRVNTPFLTSALSSSMHAGESSSELCQPGPRSCIIRPNRSRVSHASPSEVGRAGGGTAAQCRCSARAKASGSVDPIRGNVPGGLLACLHIGKGGCHRVESAAAVILEKLGLGISAGKPDLDIYELTG